jgi:hypothetical protein
MFRQRRGYVISTRTARIAVTDTPLSLNDGTDGHEMESPTTEYMGEMVPQHYEKTSSNQKVNQRLGSEGVESIDIIKMDDPVCNANKVQNQAAASIQGKTGQEHFGQLTNG